MSRLLWLINPFATLDNPYIPNRRKSLSWKARRWIARTTWIVLLVSCTALFHAGIEVACQQLPAICIQGQGKPNMIVVWAWSLSLMLIGWVVIDMGTWALAPAARPWIRIQRRWITLPALLLAVFGLPQSSFAWSSGKCDWTNTVACLENQMINVGIIINVALWNMFNKPLLVGARLVERLREILVETFFRDALNGILAGVWPLFWISVGFAILFYSMTYAMRLLVRWDVVDLQQLAKTIFLAFVFFGMGGILLSANENIRILIGQGFQEIAADAVSNTATNFSTIVDNDGSMLPPKSIYASESCDGDTTVKRTIPAIMLSDYTARFLRADAVDIHCPVTDPNQFGFVRVPTHLGPGPAASQDDIYPPSSTGAYDASPSEEEGFLFYYLEPNVQYRVFNAEEATADDRERLFSRSMDGMYIQIQAIPLGIMAILEQLLYLIFAFCSFGVWLALCLSLVFAPFMATNTLFTGQLLNLVNIAKTSWVSSLWMGILLGFFRVGASRGASLIVFVTGLIGLALVLALLAGAGSLFLRTIVDGVGSVLGSTPRATAGAFKSLGGGVKTVASGISAGVIARRMTGDRDYARGAALSQSKTLRQIAQGAAVARAVITGKSPTDSALMKGLNSSPRGGSPFDWYSIKRHAANKPTLDRNAQDANLRAVGAAHPQPTGVASRQQGHYEALNDPRRSTLAGAPIMVNARNGGTPHPIRDPNHAIHQRLASDGVAVDRQWAGHFLERGYAAQDVPGAPQRINVVKPWSAPSGRLRAMEARRREQDFAGVPLYNGRGEPMGDTHQPSAPPVGQPVGQSATRRMPSAESPRQDTAAPRQLKRVPPHRAAQRRHPAPVGAPAMSQPTNGDVSTTQPVRRQRPPAHRLRQHRAGVSMSGAAIPSTVPTARPGPAARAETPGRNRRPTRVPFARGLAARRQQGLSVVRVSGGENTQSGHAAQPPQAARPARMRRLQGGVPRRDAMERRVARRLAATAAAPAVDPRGHVAVERRTATTTRLQQPGRPQKVTPSRERMVAAQRGRVAQARQPAGAAQRSVVAAAIEKAVITAASSQPAARPGAQRSLGGTRPRVERQPTSVVSRPATTANMKINTKSNMISNPQDVVVLSAAPEDETSQNKAMKRTLNRPRY